MRPNQVRSSKHNSTSVLASPSVGGIDHPSDVVSVIYNMGQAVVDSVKQHRLQYRADAVVASVKKNTRAVESSSNHPRPKLASSSSSNEAK